MKQDEWMEVNPEIDKKTAKVYEEIEEQKASEEGKGPFPANQPRSEPGLDRKKMPDGDFVDEESVEERKWFEENISGDPHDKPDS